MKPLSSAGKSMAHFLTLNTFKYLVRYQCCKATFIFEYEILIYCGTMKNEILYYLFGQSRDKAFKEKH